MFQKSKVMISKVMILCVVLVGLISLPHSDAECNVCSALTEIACVSQTQYQVCVNNLPSGSVNTCPNNYVCSTTTAVICQPSTNGEPLACDNCNTCDSSLTFACTGVNTYALCLGTNVPSTTVGGTCGTNLVCSLNTPQICGDPAAGITATCPTADQGTVTPTPTAAPTNPPTNPLTYAQRFCQQIRINSRFTLPAGVGNSCRQYIYCYRTTTGIWSGQIYTCPSRSFYNDFLKCCTYIRPFNC